MREENIISNSQYYDEYSVDIIKYRNFTIVEPYSWFCWTWCMMGILNYFLWTTFWTKDTLDLITLVKFKDYNGKDTIDESEILLFLANMGFKISWFGITKEYLQNYVQDPKKHFQELGIDYQSNIDFEDSQKATKQLLISKNFTLWNNLLKDSDMYNIIKTYQRKNRVFLIWWDWYILRDEEEMRESNDSAWHLVVCSWIDEKTWEFIIHDPGPYMNNHSKISLDRLIKAITYSKQPLSFMMIEYEPWIDILQLW